MSEKDGSRAVYKAGIAGLLVCTVVLACRGITYIEPSYGSDFYIRIPLGMIVNGMEPGFYKHPSLFFDIVALLFRGYYYVLLMTHRVSSITDFFVEYYFGNTLVFFVIARFVSVLSFAGVVALTARAGRRIWNRRAGFIAAFFVLCSYNVLELSGRENVDTLALFLVMAVFDVSLSIMEKPTVWKYASAGALVGLAASANYPAAISCVFPVWAYLSVFRSESAGKTRIAAAPAALICAAAAFVATSPYAVFAFKPFISDIMFQTESMYEASEGREIRNIGFYYFNYLIAKNGLFLAAALPAAFWYVFKGKAKERAVIVYPVVLILFFQSIVTKEGRWIMPSMPFLFMYAGRAVDRAVELIGNRKLANAIVAAVLAAYFLMGIPARWIDTWTSGNPSPQEKASEWLLKHAKPGETVLYESYTVFYKTPAEFERVFFSLVKKTDDNFKFQSYSAFAKAAESGRFAEPEFSLAHLSETNTVGDDMYYRPEFAVALNAGWIVLNEDTMNNIRELHRVNGEKYRRMIAFYDWVKKNYRSVKTFESEKRSPDPTITIYGRKRNFTAEEMAGARAALGMEGLNLKDIVRPEKGIISKAGNGPTVTCRSAGCLALISELKRSGVGNVTLLESYDGGTAKLMIEAIVPGESRLVRLSISKTGIGMRCYARAAGLCIQYFGREGMTEGQERISKKMVGAISGMKHPESIWR